MRETAGDGYWEKELFIVENHGTYMATSPESSFSSAQLRESSAEENEGVCEIPLPEGNMERARVDDTHDDFAQVAVTEFGQVGARRTIFLQFFAQLECLDIKKNLLKEMAIR